MSLVSRDAETQILLSLWEVLSWEPAPLVFPAAPGTCFCLRPLPPCPPLLAISLPFPIGVPVPHDHHPHPGTLETMLPSSGVSTLALCWWSSCVWLSPGGGNGISHTDSRLSLSGLQTDAIDNHRSFSDKHGLTGKRELQLEAEEGRPGKARVPGCTSHHSWDSQVHVGDGGHTCLRLSWPGRT